MTEFFKHIDKLVSQSEVVIERAKNSAHHVWKCVYPVNYGYIRGIQAPDGEEQDAYLLGVYQPVKEFTGEVIAIIHREDDVEEKWVVAPVGKRFSREEIWEKVCFQEQYFHSSIRMV